MNTRDIPCSAYCQALDEASKARYLEKIVVLGFDPYVRDLEASPIMNGLPWSIQTFSTI